MSAIASPLPGTGARIIPLALIVLLHAALLYAALHGMQHPVRTPAAPREVIATFITPQPASKPQIQPAPPQPESKPIRKPAPKPAPVVKKAAVPKPALAPMPTPTEKAISTPQEPVAAASSKPEPQVAAAPPAPPAPVAPAAPKTVSGVEYVQAPQPDYPPIAKRMGEEGKVMLRVLVSERGHPEKVDIQKSSGFARLDEAARQAAMRALFKPHLENGEPVAVYALIPINFSIQ